MFRDITPILGNPSAYRIVVDAMAEPFRNQSIDAIVAVEARGYLLGAPIAYAMNSAFVPVRKLGKLPWQTVQSRYELEYGIETVEMHTDGLHEKKRVLVVDDVLATGGTLNATLDLVARAGGEVVGISVFIELAALNGRSKLLGNALHSLVVY